MQWAGTNIRSGYTRQGPHVRDTGRTRKRQMKVEITARNEMMKAEVRDSIRHIRTHTHKYSQRHVLAHNCMCSKGERQIILCDYNSLTIALPSVH